MTNGEKITFLNRYTDAERTVGQMMGELERWKNRAPEVRDMKTAAAEIEKLEGKIEKQIVKSLKIRERVIMAINTLGDSTLRELMVYRYVHGMRWAKIADKMHYESHYIMRLHAKALRSLRQEDIERYLSDMIE